MQRNEHTLVLTLPTTLQATSFVLYCLSATIGGVVEKARAQPRRSIPWPGETDSAKRMAMYAKMQRDATDRSPFVFLLQSEDVVTTRKNVSSSGLA